MAVRKRITGGYERKTSYYNQPERRDDSLTWMSGGGSERLINYDPETGHGLVMTSYGPRVQDLRDPDVSSASRRASIANYVAQEKYPEPSIAGRQADWYDREQQYGMKMGELAYADKLADYNRGPRVRPEIGTINGYPEETFMQQTGDQLRKSALAPAPPATGRIRPVPDPDYYGVGGETTAEPEIGSLSWFERLKRFRNRRRDAEADLMNYGQ